VREASERSALVKAIVTRLRTLEDQARPRVNERGQTPAEVVRERRRRRLEAAGLPFDDRPRKSFVGTQTLAEAIRMGRRRVLECERING
jgi:hypothetical protein